jgi:hypothetical protein
MSSKRPSLAAALHQVANPSPATAAPAAAAEPKASAAAAKPKAVQPGREGLRAVTFYEPPPAHAQLQMLTIEQTQARGKRTTLQDLMDEALNDLFKKYGKPPIA